MSEEVELEALPQNRILDLADRALRGSARVGDEDVDAAEMFGDAIECAAHRGRIGHVALNPERRSAEVLRRSSDGAGIDVEQRHLGPGTAHYPRGGKADRAGASGDDDNLAGERLLAHLPE